MSIDWNDPQVLDDPATDFDCDEFEALLGAGAGLKPEPEPEEAPAKPDPEEEEEVAE